MTRCIVLLLVVGLYNISIAQVQNNNIQNRLTLQIDTDPIFSSTAKSDVEWRCINKALTNKCLVYHNDQWFNFTVPVAGTYFINISGQKCRDMRGLQLIIIEGNPCETKTYRILQCIPKIIQDDVYVQLDSLKPKTQYLVNIDGFLGDFCDFGIQIGVKPNGFPRTRLIQTPDSIEVRTEHKGRLVNLKWVVSKEKIDFYESFKIYRAVPNGIKSNSIHEQPVSRNSYGAYILDYSASDSLHQEGTYIYRIMGIQKETQVPFLLVARVVEYAEPKPKTPPQRSVKLNLDFKDKTPFTVLIYDAVLQTMLKKQNVVFEKPRDYPFKIELGDFIDRGLKTFMILVTNSDTREALEFYYRLDGGGKFIKE